MENFKRELQELLRKYPQVKKVSFDVTESVSLDTPMLAMPSQRKETTDGYVPSAPLTTAVVPAYVSPHQKALTAAEQTVAALQARAGIKIQS